MSTICNKAKGPQYSTCGARHPIDTERHKRLPKENTRLNQEKKNHLSFYSMGNTPPSTSRDPIINFKWVISEIADSDDLEQAWKHYSTLATTNGGKRDSNGEIMMYKEKAFLFVEHVAKV